jgi:GT2 family glycosyltransferase
MTEQKKGSPKMQKPGAPKQIDPVQLAVGKPMLSAGPSHLFKKKARYFFSKKPKHTCDEDVLLKVDAITERKNERGSIVQGWAIDLSDENDIEITLNTFDPEDNVAAVNNKIRTDVAALYASKSKSLPLYTGYEITTVLTYSEIRRVTARNLVNGKQTTLLRREFPRVTKDLSPLERLFRTVAIAWERLSDLIREKRFSFKLSKWKEYADKVRIIRKETNIFTYDDWIVENEPKRETYEAQRSYAFKSKPLVSILTPAYNTPPVYFGELMASLQAQTYENWELCLADGGSKEESIAAFKDWQSREPRLKLNLLQKNLGIAGNTNAAADLASGEYVAFLDHDDILPPDALFEMVRTAQDTGADFIYSDSDNIDEEQRHSPFFKPDFSPDFLRAINYICHFTVMSRALFDKVGRFRLGFDGSQDHDLFLRASEQAQKIVHVPKILYHWRAHQESVALNPGSKLYAAEAGVKAVQEHMDRIGMKGKAEGAKGYLFSYRIRAEITGEPLVSIIIPNKDSKKYLKQCIDSILEKSTYQNYEILIVENNSEADDIFEYYREIEQNPKVRLVTFEGGFNFSAINNFGARHAKGEHLLLLNNDTEVMTGDWIGEMLMFSQRSDVGAVGAKLFFEDDTLQHYGVAVGIMGIAGHTQSGAMSYFPGYFTNLALARNVTAVTAACMMVKKTVFDEVGGLDEDFVVALNDIDFCLKVHKAGYYNVVTPYAQLYHFESKSRGYEDSEEKVMRYHREIFRLIDRWEELMRAGDPFYNPNLTLMGMDYGLKRASEPDYIDFYKKLKEKYIREGKL